MTEALELKLDQFEGPLDLLLHLIKQLEVDIYDIPIAEVTQQYLTYLRQMKDSQLYVAGEFIVMASTLMEIKSEYLIPRVEMDVMAEDEGDVDPRDRLTDMLVEYQLYKDLAAVLADKNEERQHLFSKSPSDLSAYTEIIEVDDRYLNPADLQRAFENSLKRYQLRHPADRIVQAEEVSLEEKGQMIMDRLAHTSKQSLDFMDCLDNHSRSHLVVSFLALLELIKNNQVEAFQANQEANIFIRLVSEQEEN